VLVADGALPGAATDHCPSQKSSALLLGFETQGPASCANIVCGKPHSNTNAHTTPIGPVVREFLFIDL